MLTGFRLGLGVEQTFERLACGVPRFELNGCKHT